MFVLKISVKQKILISLKLLLPIRTRQANKKPKQQPSRKKMNGCVLGQSRKLHQRQRDVVTKEILD